MAASENKGIFGDRRNEDRRRQSLAIPSELDRRGGSRRGRSFDSQPWWLRVDYAEELVSEKRCAETGNSKTAKQANTRIKND